MNNYKAKIINGEIIIQPIIKKTQNKKGGTDVKIKIPSFSLMAKAIKEHGKRNLQ